VRDFWENGCSRAERRTNRRRLWCGVPSFEGELPDRGQWTQAVAGGRVIPPSGSHRATAAATPAPSAQEGGGAGAAAAAAAVVGATGQRAAQGGGCRRPRVSSVDSRSATTGADERNREAQRNSRRACHPSQSSKASSTKIKEDKNGRPREGGQRPFQARACVPPDLPGLPPHRAAATDKSGCAASLAGRRLPHP